ncbi:serine/arginine-rich splicing factor 11-like [Pectinophora gossypiella]|uniref:serine/arginine-rich splicing factor 11-like n=1 Tax=Pectinophora gossypiella TaxID=13191 RepID=UPI00214F14E1|nr:serine/arginine-rich splicing factor 11-like [Pectinophora gossypiella]
MEPPDRHQSRHSDGRRVETPTSRRDAASRSRSRLRDDARSPPRERSRSQRTLRSPDRQDEDLEQDRARIKALEAELLRERERLLRSERCRSTSMRRDMYEREEVPRRRDHHSLRPATSSQCGDDNRRGWQREQAERRNDDDGYTRSRSPSISKKDLIDIFNCLKEGLTSHPSTSEARPTSKIDHTNMLPNFDPSAKNQRIEVWLKKVNECATVYGWDDRTIIHFATQNFKVWPKPGMRG